METKYKSMWENISDIVKQVIGILNETTRLSDEIEYDLQTEYSRIDALQIKYEEKIVQLKHYCASCIDSSLKGKICSLLLLMIKQNERLAKRNVKNSQTFAYNKKNSILNELIDEYIPTIEEWQKLYVFYVAYSMGKNQSGQGKTYLDYGWKGPTLNSSGLKSHLEKILQLSNFRFLDHGEDLKENFEDLGLIYPIEDLESERGVFAKTPGSSKYDKFFYRIRNCFAHGGFHFLFNKERKIMVVLEDHSSDNVSARIVIKLETLLKIVNCIDKNDILSSGEQLYSEGKVLVKI